ncbi:LutC/YkgG family protein [Neptunomonas antarctica]|uniref:L-lactate dehydrogenase complex protein LldG n=1 Tax=Neptunomonas antarctica TaxID=619304 RepID=A0A1N7M4E6_9GAMM|nr:lactate utilization protein [Neptunomonas antarctica]SIS80913.1 L-lactate dehydrogenase complex protein LldG [Neptunomonas antarctica]
MSKAEILGNIRRGLKRGEASEEQKQAVLNRINQHARNLIPQRSQLSHAGQIELFIAMATEAAAELFQLNSITEVPQICATWLKDHHIDTLVTASDEAILGLDWDSAAELTCVQRVAQVGDSASLTTSFAGIAETGTLMLHSGKDSPTTLNFLPDNHFVILNRSDIVGPYEDAWQKLRDKTQGELPRTVNMITGPSRSADIEQTLQMGAHGPKDLIILLIND